MRTVPKFPELYSPCTLSQESTSQEDQFNDEIDSNDSSNSNREIMPTLSNNFLSLHNICNIIQRSSPTGSQNYSTSQDDVHSLENAPKFNDSTCTLTIEAENLARHDKEDVNDHKIIIT